MIVDLNSDIGEGFGVWGLADDTELLDVVTSANVACGFHAGDPATMRQVCERAVASGVVIGAHVGYRDLVGFGRRRMEVSYDELRDDVLYQIGALDAFAHSAGDRVRYVKAHGALYNTAVDDGGAAAAIVAAVTEYDPTMAVVCLPDSELVRQSRRAGLNAIDEAFADRAYDADGRLVPRSCPGAVLHDPISVAARCVDIVASGFVMARDGSRVPLKARSVCVHGDTPGAIAIARHVRQALREHGVTVAPFVET